MSYRLNVNPDFHPVKQKRRAMALKRQKAASKKVRKLFKAGSIREVQFADWLANVALVKKSNNRWRLCVDFTNLKKACYKDCYLLP